MKHCDFKIGLEFYTETSKWRCTDVGTRTILAIRAVENKEDWEAGPPYAICEVVFDENDLPGCFQSIKEKTLSSDDTIDALLERVEKRAKERIDALNSSYLVDLERMAQHFEADIRHCRRPFWKHLFGLRVVWIKRKLRRRRR